ncbi:MAG: hypothetical protein NC483_05585 [Ruminococcus sp.]|nr:hypothetical protein [Ruminococcus sp.]
MLNVDLEHLRAKTNRELNEKTNEYNSKVEEKNKLVIKQRHFKGYLALITVYKNKRGIINKFLKDLSLDFIYYFVIFMVLLISFTGILPIGIISLILSLVTAVCDNENDLKELKKARKALKKLNVNEEELKTNKKLEEVIERLRVIKQDLPQLKTKIENKTEALNQIETTIWDLLDIYSNPMPILEIIEGPPLTLARTKNI